MLPITIGICDDDKIFIDEIKSHLALLAFEHDFDLTIDAFTNSKTFLSSSQEYDIVFLDMNLGDGVTGIEVGKQLRERRMQSIIIIMTNHMDFSLDGYEIQAFRYLLKPINKAELWKALRAAIFKMESDNTKIQVISNYSKRIIYVRDIIYIQTEYRKRKIVLVSGELVFTRMTLQELKDAIDKPYFLIAQRGYLLNCNYIDAVFETSVRMQNGDSISLKRDKDNNVTFHASLDSWLKGKIQ